MSDGAWVPVNRHFAGANGAFMCIGLVAADGNFDPSGSELDTRRNAAVGAAPVDDGVRFYMGQAGAAQATLDDAAKLARAVLAMVDKAKVDR